MIFLSPGIKFLRHFESKYYDHFVFTYEIFLFCLKVPHLTAALRQFYPKIATQAYNQTKNSTTNTFLGVLQGEKMFWNIKNWEKSVENFPFSQASQSWSPEFPTSKRAKSKKNVSCERSEWCKLDTLSEKKSAKNDFFCQWQIFLPTVSFTDDYILPTINFYRRIFLPTFFL